MRTILKLSFILYILLFVLSCRTTPENDKFTGENNSSNPVVSIKINSIKVGYQNEIAENQPISENNSGGGVIL